jgi:hypothetical protein
MDKVIAEVKSEKQISEKEKIVARLQLHDLGQGPYFSATIDRYEINRGRWVGVGGGADHKSLAKYFPEFAKYLKWHLVNEGTGPMHYIANSLYFAGKGKYSKLDAEAFCRTAIIGALPDEGYFTSDELATCDADDIKETLAARLPALMRVFRADMRELFRGQIK